MAFTCMGNPIPPVLLRSQYRVLLSKIESGEISVRLTSVLNTVMKSRHVFRGGTSIDDDGDKERRRYYQDLISECKTELVKTKAAIKKKVNKGKSTKKSKRTKNTVKVDLVGRRVIMDADVFGGNALECYHGIVVKKGRYQENGKTIKGYLVRWHIGDSDYWFVSHTHMRFLRTYSHTLLQNLPPHTHSHMRTCLRSYDQLVNCLVDEDNGNSSDVFVESDWVELMQVKVVEAVDEFPEGWRMATIYRLCKDPEKVCLYFGGDEYEGFEEHSHYSFVDDVLRDNDGVRIELISQDPVVSVSDVNLDLEDPELQELEENGGGYLSNSDDDGDFLFGGDGDKKTLK